MRAAVLVVIALAACTPDVVSDSYYCGPNASCPDGQTCNGTNNHCVLGASAAPFACAPDSFKTEPDDTAAQAFAAPDLGCQGVPFVEENCMVEGDAEDWVKFQVASACSSAVQVGANVSFPLAYERIALEVWDLGQMTKVGEDEECAASGSEGVAGDELRCLTKTLVPGTSYGIKVRPAGDGDCDGSCRFNRYTLRVQLSTP